MGPGLVLLLAVALALPAIAPDSATTNMAVFTVMYVGLATAWNIMGGYTGYISLGHAGFFGFGSYTLGIVLASRMRRMESFQMVMALVLQPMIFLSGAIFPLERLPGWLAVPCRLNPAAYGVDLARRALLGQKVALTIAHHVVPIWGDIVIVLALGAALLGVATRLFGRLA